MDRAATLMPSSQSRNYNLISVILSLFLSLITSFLIILNLLNIFPAILLVSVLLINSYARYHMFKTE